MQRWCFIVFLPFLPYLLLTGFVYIVRPFCRHKGNLVKWIWNHLSLKQTEMFMPTALL